MTNILLVVALIYALFTLTLWLTWVRMPTFRADATFADGPMLSVVIPCRNEAEHIGDLLGNLSQQTYRNFEVIVADDASTDATLAVVQRYVSEVPYTLTPLPLADDRSASPKKRAIAQSIALARGELIVTTDGDCRVGPDWLRTIAAFYQQTGAKLISGPVTFTTESGFFDSLQTVEFASLIGSGAVTITLGRPTMCNGANLCYVKAVYEEVGGFAGVDHLASGDDEFLMHKVADRYPNGVRFLKSPDAVLQTHPHRSWRAFYQQRKRWASKWRAYQSLLPSLLAVFVFLSNAAPVMATLGWLSGQIDEKTLLFVLGLKALPEFLFLRSVLVFLQKRASVVFILPTQLLYPLYVVFFGLVAQGKGYQWKGRKLT